MTDNANDQGSLRHLPLLQARQSRALLRLWRDRPRPWTQRAAVRLVESEVCDD